MPELPEVETVRRVLKDKLVGAKIIDVKLFYPKIIEYPTSDLFLASIINQKINDVKRRGKWLMFELDDYYLLSHLRMEGKYNFKHANDEVGKHEHVSIILDNGLDVRYQDVRKFGRMHLIKKEEVNTREPLSFLGLEPWDEQLTVEYLKSKYKSKKLPIKTVILDQTIIVGVGNIYADEILFRSLINPLKAASELTNNELTNIIKNTQVVLDAAINAGGTTIRTFSAGSVHGSFQDELKVHGQENKLCATCGRPVTKIKVGGRGTYYCEYCQK